MTALAFEVLASKVYSVKHVRECGRIYRELSTLHIGEQARGASLFIDTASKLDVFEVPSGSVPTIASFLELSIARYHDVELFL